ncbi:alpha/beta fold hydrolase [Mesorhizobium sp. M0239]|uniref:alpha/beta fold hydrolase n=1 Tax=Mesorhizobium sp. M0239 TaxID=2956924 RepID=UPI003335896C
MAARLWADIVPVRRNHALGRDCRDGAGCAGFADALGLSRFAVVGHDWGARISYLLASVFPDRIKCCAALSLGWQPGKPATPAPGLLVSMVHGDGPGR